MLSFIYRLINDFEHSHDQRPNVLYLNPAHFRQLCDQFADPADIRSIVQRLDMEIVLEPDAVHPHVAALGHTTRHAAAG